MTSGLPLGWLLGSAVLLVISLGLGGLFKALLSVILCVGGGLVIVYVVTDHSGDGHSSSSTSRSRQNWSKTRRSALRVPSVPALSPQLTGIPLIDGELHQVIAYVHRDYVQSWQAELTHTNDFSTHVQEATTVVISSLARRIRQVDWMPFLTTR